MIYRRFDIEILTFVNGRRLRKTGVLYRVLYGEDWGFIQDEAVRQGFAAIGIRGKNVVILGAEKRPLLALQEERIQKKIVPLDKHVALVFAGYMADARVMINRAQMECQSHRLTVEDAVTLEYIARYIAEMKQKHTQSTGRRPFGISCLIGGFDYDGSPHLFQTEPSGNYYEWKAAATGRYDKTVTEFLEKNYKPELVATDKGAIELAVRALLEIVTTNTGERNNLEIAVMKRGERVRMLEPKEIDKVAERIKRE